RSTRQKPTKAVRKPGSFAILSTSARTSSTVAAGRGAASSPRDHVEALTNFATPGRSPRPLTEQPRREAGEVFPPHRPTVVPLGEMPFMSNALLLQQGGQLLVLAEEEIVLAAGDPEQLEPLVHRARVGEGRGDRGGRGGGGAEGSDPSEGVELV